MEKYRKEVMGARLILVECYIQSSPEHVTHLVAQRMFDRSHDLIGLANDALSRKHPVPAGPALIEPLNDDRRDHPPAQKIRHPRNVRILPPPRAFHLEGPANKVPETTKTACIAQRPFRAK